MWLRPRPASLPSGILIHAAIWLLYTCQKFPLGPLEELGPHLNKVAWAEAYLHTKWHVNPSRRLATTDMGQKLGAVPLLGELGPHLTNGRPKTALNSPKQLISGKKSIFCWGGQWAPVLPPPNQALLLCVELPTCESCRLPLTVKVKHILVDVPTC